MSYVPSVLLSFDRRDKIPFSPNYVYFSPNIKVVSNPMSIKPRRRALWFPAIIGGHSTSFPPFSAAWGLRIWRVWERSDGVDYGSGHGTTTGMMYVDVCGMATIRHPLVTIPPRSALGISLNRHQPNSTTRLRYL